jgi:putative acyl-CoA dehydrogenase
MAALGRELQDMNDLEYRARDIVDRMSLAIQAALLVQHAPHIVSDAFCRSRLAPAGHRNYGALPRGADCRGIIARAWPTPG